MTGLTGSTTDSGVRSTIDSQIIPRLVLSCRSSLSGEHPHKQAVAGDIGQSQIREFGRLLTAEEPQGAARYVAELRQQGRSLEWLYLELFGPTAQYLGNLWEQDESDFMDVTLGVGRLQQMVREFSPEFQTGRVSPDPRRRVLLMPMPGEDHTFGLTLVAEFFRRAEWNVWGWPLVEEKELSQLIRNQWFAIIGISVAGQVSMRGLAALIREIRRDSVNPSVGMIVGGPVFLQQPELTRKVGADATAVDALQAVQQAESLLEMD